MDDLKCGGISDVRLYLIQKQFNLLESNNK